jgi:CRISPR-associated protein Csb2
MGAALLVGIRFPAGAYRGSDLGAAEELPTPARLHAAFVAAAGGGPSATPRGRVLVADASDREAVCWLERTEPLGMLKPPTALVSYAARRHRVRVAVDAKERHDHHREETEFEPFSAMGGAVVFAWPRPAPELAERLKALAREITHVGRADATAVVSVWEGEFDPAAPGAYEIARGRGAGYQLRVPLAGRHDALAAEHERSLQLGPRRHDAGLKSKQASDLTPAGIGSRHTELRRFAPRTPGGPWPYGEVWRVLLTGLTAADLSPRARVQSAVLIHRALVAALGSDVPEFVTGRAGDGPAAGSGHLAIQLLPPLGREASEVLLALPAHVPDADRARLLEVVANAGSLTTGRRKLTITGVELDSALAFWPAPAQRFATAVPLVLDSPGTPRQVPWTLNDATVCSIGYALRGVLEDQGFAWGTGWDFRVRLVSELRLRGVAAHAIRVLRDVGRFVHHAREGDLLVAVHAVVELGDLAGGGRGLLALGRARHLGGGLLVPLRPQRQEEDCLRSADVDA